MVESGIIQGNLFSDELAEKEGLDQAGELMDREQIEGGLSLVDRVEELILCVNSQNAILNVYSPGHMEMSSLWSKELRGKRLNAVMNRELGQVVSEGAEEVLRSNSMKSFECRSSSQGIDTEYEVRIFASGKGDTYIVIRNVSESRHAQWSLMEIESRYRKLADHSLQGTMIIQDFRVVHANSAVSRITGYTVRELLDLSPEELTTKVHPADRDLVWGRFRDRLNDKPVPQNYEMRMRCKDGSYKWMELYASKIDYKGGPAVQVSLVDVTDKKRTQQELYLEKAYIEELFERAPAAIVLIDNHGRVLRLNREFVRTFGYTMDEIEGKLVDDLLAPAELHEEAVSITKRIMAGEQVYVETVRRRKDGSTINVSISGSPVKVDGDQVAVYGIYSDITNRKRAEEALRESDEKYRGIFHNAQVGMFRYAIADGRALECNERHAQLFGYENREQCISQFRAPNHCVESETWNWMIRKIQRNRGIQNFENQFLRQDGSVFWTRLSAILNSEKGFIEGVLTDITEEKKAIEEMGKSEERYRILVENATDAIIIVQKEKIKYHNPRTELLFGYTAEELKDRKFLAIIHPEDRNRLMEVYKRWLVEEDTPSTLSVRKIRKNGDMLWGEINAVRIMWEGEPAILCFIRDITSEKQLGAQLQQAQKMEAIGTLAGGIAHDFNNLLQAVLGYSDLLLMNKKREEQGYRELRGIQNAALRASELTQQLLTFSRKVESKLRPVNLNNEVTQVHELLQRTIPKMISIELRLERSLHTVNADQSQIGQAIMNLAVNAKDAMPDGGRLIIETENVMLDDSFCKSHVGSKPGKHVLLSVRDTGHGMDKKTMAHIFEPFYTTKKTGTGTGLGLAMVYGIVKSHSGYIHCSSTRGKGTDFRIYLPVIEQEVSIEEEMDDSLPKGGTETILLIDDERLIRDLGEKALSRFGYMVLTAPDGESAVKLYGREHERIDLIILDLIMPKMSGTHCFEEIMRINPQAKVIIASGYSKDKPLSDLLERRSRGFIGKPFNVKQLLRMIRGILDE
jgi:PAS domain S-box-containing protein